MFRSASSRVGVRTENAGYILLGVYYVDQRLSAPIQGVSAHSSQVKNPYPRPAPLPALAWRDRSASVCNGRFIFHPLNFDPQQRKYCSNPLDTLSPFALVIKDLAQLLDASRVVT